MSYNPFGRYRNFSQRALFVNTFAKGLVTRVEKEAVPRGSASESLNWHFLGDRIELRRGQQRLGGLTTGDGNTTFTRVFRTYAGTQIPFWGYLRKLFYYDSATQTNIEIGTDTLPAAAQGEDLSAAPYQSIAGSFAYLTSPNSSVYKIPIANPGSVVDQLQDTFRGNMKIGQGRSFLWNRKDKFGGADKTGLYVSGIDRDSLADYPRTTAEKVGTGDGATTQFSGTLAFKATYPKRTTHFMRFAAATSPVPTLSGVTQGTLPVATTTTPHGLAVGDVLVFQSIVGMTELNDRIAVVVTVPSTTTFTFDIDTTAFTAYSSGGTVGKSELFIDNRDGTLTGNHTGTGTINYATGAFTLTFATAPVNSADVVTDYYTEDATDQGILDFDQGSGTSINDSMTFRQDDAGFFMNLGIIGSTIYCYHTIKTYALRLVSTDDITNLPYRNKVGIPNQRASYETADGIYYVDVTDPQNPAFRLLAKSAYSTEDLPQSISNNLDLTGYTFDDAVVFEFGVYVCFACRTIDETANNRLFMFNRIWKSWELHSFRIADMDTYNGALIAGDSASCNLYKLFSGVADEDGTIENHLVLGNDNLDMEGVKDLRRFEVAGLIGDDQQLEISYSLDNQPFVSAKTITGTGAYVDSNLRKVIGSTTLGQDLVGGGQQQEDAIYASPYRVSFFIGTKRFERIRIKFEALNTGYVSIAQYGFMDYRYKGKRLPTQYQA